MAYISTDPNQNNQIQRSLSVHFSTKFIKGLNHTEVLNQLETLVDKNTIKAIQLTEKDCVVTVNDRATKVKLLVKGLDLKNHHFRFMDVEKEVTNVTIKDLPVELSDLTVCTYMKQYGEVVQGSMKRGTIKDTVIETGTRYIQLINCVPIIPNNTTFGRFEVRLFADNNRTKCRHCEQTDHPSYRCDQRPQRKSTKSCYRCGSYDHVVKDCEYSDNVCFNCGKEGHMKRNCPSNVHDTEKDPETETTERQLYGDYFHDIIEGREANKDNKETDQKETQKQEQQTVDKSDINVNKDITNLKQPTPNPDTEIKTVIIGASNCCRLKLDSSICNLSVTGSTAENIDTLLETADGKVDAQQVTKVLFSLGTNDITKNKTDQDIVNVYLSNAIHKVKEKFPNANVVVLGILPRKGKSPTIVKCNLTSTFANSFLHKLCSKDLRLSYVDLWSEFAPKNSTIKALYDDNDQSGVHISTEGAIRIVTIINDVISTENLHEYQTPERRKRTRSDQSTPGSAEKQIQKMQKST